MNAPSHRWFVVQTQVNAESKAVQNLARQGFETYLPRFEKRRRHARKVELVAAPLFSRYLFVRIDMATQRWRAIQSTLGVSHLVTHGSAPAPVPDRVIAALRDAEDGRGLVRLQSKPTFAPGAKVRVLGGAFMDNLGFYEGQTDKDRIAILLDLLGRQVRVVLDGDLVTAA
jgi:transcriptional antiterminator RfaH